MKRVLIIAGEASGDLYGAHLAAALKRRSPDIQLCGAGGPLMRQAGVQILHDVTEHAAVGLWEVVASVPRVVAVFKKLVAHLERDKPTAVVLIDYPEFNLRFARRARRLGVPVIYYISPQVWAWRTGRVHQVARYVHRMLVIFPFEEQFYRRHGVQATFVGHPLLDILREVPSRQQAREDLGVPSRARVIGLLPGSRTKEFDRLFPIMLKAAERIREQVPGVRFLLGCAPVICPARVQRHVRRSNIPVQEVYSNSYRVMRASDLLLVASGTATVEAAILNVPMIVTYRVATLTWLLFSGLMKVDTYAMVNIVAGRHIVPELIQKDASPQRLAAEAVGCFRDSRLTVMQSELEQVVRQFGAPGASDRAADEIFKVIAENPQCDSTS